MGWLSRLWREPEPPKVAEPRLTARAPVRTRPSAVRSRPGDAFTPTQPKTGRRQVTGRQVELERILRALHEERAHVVLYTERGRGKTSLANLVVEALRQGGVIVARHTCEAGSSFDDVMRGLMRDLPRSLLAVAANDASEVGCETALPGGELRPRDVLSVLSRLTCRSLICVVDEFDRIQDPGTRTRLADTIKQLSDQSVPLSFMIVGVSENLDQILGQHPSIQRNLVAVHLPLLTDAEIASVIEKGARDSGFALFPSAAERVAGIARGSPHVAQLLGLRLMQAAMRRNDSAVREQDFQTAVASMLAEAPQAWPALHATVVAGDPDMEQALRSVAQAEQDRWGRIRVTPSFRDGVVAGHTNIGGARWKALTEAGVLRHSGDGPGLFVFAERGFMHHILLLAAQAPAVAEIRAGAPVSGPQPASRPRLSVAEPSR